MVWAKLSDFAYRDLRDPTASRVRRILSALINFHLFAKEQGPVIDEHEAAFDNEAKLRESTAQDVDEMRNKIVQRKGALEQDAKEEQQLAGEIDKRRKKLIKLKEMEDPALKHMEKAKYKRNTLQARVENLSMALKQHDSEIVRLRGRIVQSPDRVRQTIQDMATALQKLKDEILEVDRTAREHDSRINVARKYEAVSRSIIAFLQTGIECWPPAYRTSCRSSNLSMTGLPSWTICKEHHKKDPPSKRQLPP